MTNFENMRERLLLRAGLLEVPKPLPGCTFESLARTEWSDEFEQFMRNRLVMGALRYGKLRASGKPQFRRLAKIREKLEFYAVDGNDERLVDIANLALVEFVEGKHPLKHWQPSDDMDHTLPK